MSAHPVKKASRVLRAHARLPRLAMTRHTSNLIDLASRLPAGHRVRRRILSSLREGAGWEDEALRELAKEMDLDADDFKTRRGTGRNSMEVYGAGRGSNGESEWVVFKTWKDAESYAEDYVKEQIEDEPEIFNQNWLKGHYSISDTDARIYASEDASFYVEDIKTEDDGERVCREADMDDEWDAIQEMKGELDDLVNFPEDELPDSLSDYNKEWEKAKKANPDDLDAAASDFSDEVEPLLEKRREELVDEAAEALEEKMSDETEKELKSDPIGYFEDRFGEWEPYKRLLHIDAEAAAKDAIRADGVDHFLDRYDGDHTELGRNAVAFGTN